MDALLHYQKLKDRWLLAGHLTSNGCEKARLLKCWKVDSERHSVSASVLNGAVIPHSLTLIQIDLVS